MREGDHEGAWPPTTTIYLYQKIKEITILETLSTDEEDVNETVRKQ